MRATRLRLTHSLFSLLLLGAAACGTTESNDDAGAGQPSPAYALCDGSEAIRLGYQIGGGGQAPDGYEFLHPFGYQFFYVDGKCNVVLATGDEPAGSVVRGQMSAALAQQVEQKLELAQLPYATYFDLGGGCSDAPAVTLATDRFFGSCTCGCDPGVPEAFEQGLAQMDDVLASVGDAADSPGGAVEVAALETSVLGIEPPPEWPFSFAIDEIANVRSADPESSWKRRALTGDDAALARQLRADAHARTQNRQLLVRSGERMYELFVRDEVEPDLTNAVAAFARETNPGFPKPIARCAGERSKDPRFTIAFLVDHKLYATLQSDPVCGQHICWDGEFLEKYPVLVPLRVHEDAHGRACLGMKQSGLSVDLSPIVDAYRASYPDSKLEIDLSLPGWSGGGLDLQE